jgi:hypothetical protein
VKRTNAFGGALLGLAIALTSSARSARALAAGPADTDEVDLVDGTALRGRITQQAVGSYVVIQTDDGRVQSIPWSQIKRVSASAPPVPPLPPPANAVSPIGPPVPASPPPPPPAPATPATPNVDLRSELGARLGYSFASGDYLSGLPIGSPSASALAPGISGGIPITLDLGMRIARAVYVGAFASYAVLMTTCPAAAPGDTLTCDGHDVRAGIDAQIHFIPSGSVDPWVGFGFGHDWLTVNLSGGPSGSAGASVRQTLDGWNFADLMVGVDLHVTRGLALGPYLEATSGSFASASASASGGGAASQSQSSDISNQSSHQWFTLGVRGTYEVL